MADKGELELPAGRQHIIERPRLTRLLDETSARVIMLVAPAGYGKTTLARQWLQNRPHAWYQGSAASVDVAALALGLADAAERLVPRFGRRLREWLPTSREPEREVDVIVELLEEGFVTWPNQAWIVIDDYHFLATKAEELIRRLFADGNIRLLLTSRRRPAWCSARELLYGNAFELGQSSLAMSMDEANTILASIGTEAATGLVAVANGWPAVIGLAALTPSSLVVDKDLPEELHDYFAEELFASLPKGTRESLSRLALVSVVTREAADVLLGPSAHHVVQAAFRAGMFTGQRTAELEFHPLLRAFLARKLREFPSEDLVSAVSRAGQYLIRIRSWDEAFSLISEFGRLDLLDPLLSQAIVPLTTQGRLSTLREWVAFAQGHSAASAYLDLADAELSFRQGRYERAEALATAASSSLNPHDPLRSLAHYRAGQSRHLMDDSDRALCHFRKAHEYAKADSDARNALWGQFVVASELEQDEARELLSAFEAVDNPDRDTAVRSACGRLMLAVCDSLTIPTAFELNSMADLVEDASDPLVRSAFWRSIAAVLVLKAEYTGALKAVDRALYEADRFHLDFVRPHTLVSRTAAYIGLKQFRHAQGVLSEIETASRRMNDQYLAANVRILRCRLFLSQGWPEGARYIAPEEGHGGPTPSLQMEFAATRAAALACAGKPDAALRLLSQIENLSGWLEPRLLVLWTRSVCSSMLGLSDAADQIRDAYADTISAQAFDLLVFACRLHPVILATLAHDKGLHESLADVLARSNDHHLAQAHGIVAGKPTSGDASALTPRELEVYALLAEGRSNREIAHALFISEVTVKVHVRHILRKLGVRTRTEAAVQAFTMQWPQGVSDANRVLDSHPPDLPK